MSKVDIAVQTVTEQTCEYHLGCAEIHRRSGNVRPTDLILICENKKIQVHKNVVCTHSKVLRTAFTGPFRVRNITLYIRPR